MEFEFDDKNLDRLYTDRQFTAGYAQEVVRAFRMRMQQIAAFHDERDFYGNPPTERARLEVEFST